MKYQFDLTCYAYPEQYDVKDGDLIVAYVRFRHDCLTVNPVLPKWKTYSWVPGGKERTEQVYDFDTEIMYEEIEATWEGRLPDDQRDQILRRIDKVVSEYWQHPYRDTSSGRRPIDPKTGDFTDGYRDPTDEELAERKRQAEEHWKKIKEQMAQLPPLTFRIITSRNCLNPQTRQATTPTYHNPDGEDSQYTVSGLPDGCRLMFEREGIKTSGGFVPFGYAEPADDAADPWRKQQPAFEPEELTPDQQGHIIIPTRGRVTVTGTADIRHCCIAATWDGSLDHKPDEYREEIRELFNK